MEVERESGASGASGPDPSGKDLNNKRRIRLREMRLIGDIYKFLIPRVSRNNLAVLVRYE
jgi:hypothetical protein